MPLALTKWLLVGVYLFDAEGSNGVPKVFYANHYGSVKEAQQFCDDLSNSGRDCFGSSLCGSAPDTTRNHERPVPSAVKGHGIW